MLRALHRIVDAEPWVVDDPVSVALFGAAVRAQLQKEPAWLQDAAGTALRGHVLVRSAFAEERLQAAVGRGIRQCVLLGAGFDTFAYRQPAWMHGVRVFEVDAPATQREKLERLARAGIANPGNLVYVPLDLERTPLGGALCAAGFDAHAPAFFSWLGVMVYLSAAAAGDVFRYVATLPAGSEIAFTFTQPGGDERLARRVAEAGEPLRTRIEASKLEPLLRTYGFSRVERLTAGKARDLLGRRSDSLDLPRRESIAAATV